MSPEIDRYMTFEDTKSFVARLMVYFPSYSPVKGTAELFHADLQKYKTSEVAELLEDVKRKENPEDRKDFVPSFPRLLGYMDDTREAQAREEHNQKLLAPPSYSSIDEPMETYSYKVSRTKPQSGKKDEAYEVRQATRVSRQRFEEIKKKKAAEGYEPRLTPIIGNTNGACRLEWVRVA